MANKRELSSQEMLQHSYDDTTGVLGLEVLAQDLANGILRRLQADANGFLMTLVMAKDTASGSYYPVTGSFDTNGNFVLNTSGSGTGTGGGSSPTTGNPLGPGPFLWITYS